MATQASDTARLVRELDTTRARLGSHLEELQGRLSPGQVLDDLMGYFRGGEGAEFGRTLLENVKGNPMPAAITSIGLAWLMASSPRAGSATPTPERSPVRLPVFGHDDHVVTMARVNSARTSVTRNRDEDEEAWSARVDHAQGQALGLARHSEETTGSFAERIGHAISAIEQAATGKVHDVRDAAGSAASSAGSAIGSAGTRAQGGLQDAASYAGGAMSSGGSSAGQMGSNLIAAITESPVLLGALGLAAGALLGALLPQSDQEEATLKGVAGQARDAVQSLKDEGMERGGRVVQAVTDGAKNAASDHGLGDRSPGELVDAALSGQLAKDVKQATGDVLRTGDEAVRKEGLT